MNNNKQRTWWQEMGAISRGMIFLEGSIASPSVLRDTDSVPQKNASAPASVPARPPRASIRRRAWRMLENLSLLGGRPVTVRHNDDIDEPFPRVHRGHAKRTSSFSEGIASKDSLSRTCATC